MGKLYKEMSLEEKQDHCLRTSAYSKTHREQVNKWALNYYYRNKEKVAIKAKLWRENNRDYVRLKQRDGKRKRKEQAIAYLGAVCKYCGNSFHPACFEFHHRNPQEKDRDPSKMLQLSWEKLTNELDKCDLLCANCHRLEHHKKDYEWNETILKQNLQRQYSEKNMLPAPENLGEPAVK